MRTRTRASAEAAVRPMQLYRGSINYASVPAQQKLRRVLDRALARVLADHPGASPLQVWEQVEAEARRRGLVRPVPGQHS